MSNDGGQAFPLPAANFSPMGDMALPELGMTLRDYFAAAALAHPYAQGDDTHMNRDKAAAWAYELADAMLAARDV